jgi:integral membrane protein
VQAAVGRYRAMAYVVGTLLVVLVFVAVPVKYIGGEPALSSIVSPVHGLLYMVYLAFAFDLYRRAGWPLSRMAVMVAAGLVPFLAFFIERKITQEVRAAAEA